MKTIFLIIVIVLMGLGVAYAEIITFRFNLADDFMADLSERSDWALVKYDTETSKIISFNS